MQTGTTISDTINPLGTQVERDRLDADSRGCNGPLRCETQRGECECKQNSRKPGLGLYSKGYTSEKQTHSLRSGRERRVGRRSRISMLH
eukprot:1357216-Amorphochlora_amoeboformis.AAC.1